MNEIVADPICSIQQYMESIGLENQVVSGAPAWLAGLGVILVILFSHWYVSRKNRVSPAAASYPKLNLLAWGPVRRLVRQSYFPLAVQSVSLFLFLLIIAAGLFGNKNGNIGPVLTWTWWWALLIFILLGFGAAFCAACPWEALSSLATSLSLKSRVKMASFELKWPKWAANILPATLLFVVLTWFELGNDVTHSPAMTAIMAMFMAGTAILLAIFFERRAFCRYVCLVGRISGMYALFSPVEVRVKSADVCKSCASKACYHGTETAVGCPTHLFPGALRENTYCTLCTECVRSCPSDNMALNIRPPATDLVNKKRFQWDEALLAITLLALTSFHGFTMTPLWTRINQILRAETGLGSALIFTLLMAVMLILPALLFWMGAMWAKKLVGPSPVSVYHIFRGFAYALIPVALFYHLAHNSMHFFLEAGSLFPLLSDPFGWGWNLFGTADETYGPLLSLNSIWAIQVVFIVIGHVYGVIVADRIARRLFADKRQRTNSLLPQLATMILYSSFSIWLIAQPMDMRTSM